METETPTTYPQFFRKAGRCLRIDSPPTGWTIGLPPEFKVPVRSCDTYPSAGHLEALLKDFEPITQDEFKNFLFTFYQQVGHEREAVSKTTTP